MSVRLDWKGDELAKKVTRASETALRQTGTAAVAEARADHPGWHSRTGAAEASIAASPPATDARGTRSFFGFGLRRGIFLELTTRGHVGDRTIARATEHQGRLIAKRIRDLIQKR